MIDKHSVIYYYEDLIKSEVRLETGDDGIAQPWSVKEKCNILADDTQPHATLTAHSSGITNWASFEANPDSFIASVSLRWRLQTMRMIDC